MLTVDPGAVSLRQLHAIWLRRTPVALEASTHSKILASAELVRETVSGETAVYGVNTGFGKLASVQIPADDTWTLQRNLILSS